MFIAFSTQLEKPCLAKSAEIQRSVTQTCDFGMPFLFNNLLTILFDVAAHSWSFKAWKQLALSNPTVRVSFAVRDGYIKPVSWKWTTQSSPSSTTTTTTTHPSLPCIMHTALTAYCLVCSGIVTIFISFPQSTSCSKCLLNDLYSPYILRLGVSLALWM